MYNIFIFNKSLMHVTNDKIALIGGFCVVVVLSLVIIILG